MPATYRGRFSDGATAAATAATVRLAPGGIEIAAADGAASVTWPYRELSTGSHLHSDAADVLLRHSGTPGATLFVADRDFVAALAARAPHLTSRARRWRVARPLLALAAVVVVLVAALWVADVRPTQGLARAIPTPVRQALGRQVVEAISGGRGACHTPDGDAALGRLTDRLSEATGGRRFTINVVNWDLLNAFAAPGEQIVLTRAVIEKAKSPDEVAGVLAHEMGHGIELHPESTLIRAIGLSAIVELMVGGNSGTLANLGVLLVQLGYSREAEREADAHAVRVLKNAGISPKGLGDFFETIESQAKDNGDGGGATGKRLLSFLSTHPLTKERIAMVRSQPAYPATPALSDAEWQALRQICAGLAAGRPKRDQSKPNAPETRDKPGGIDL